MEYLWNVVISLALMFLHGTCCVWLLKRGEYYWAMAHVSLWAIFVILVCSFVLLAEIG